MWSYNYTSQEELRHFGILGQKWGVRRYQDKSGGLTLAGKLHKREVEKREANLKKLKEDREKIYNTKGAANIAYINKSKDIIEAKGKLRIAQGKRDHNDVDKLVGKSMVDDAKYLKKPNSAVMEGIESRKYLYPRTLSSDERKAIRTLEWDRGTKSIKNEKYASLGKTLALAGIGVSAATAVSVATQILKSNGNLSVKSFMNKKNASQIGKSTIDIAKNIVNMYLSSYLGGVQIFN